MGCVVSERTHVACVVMLRRIFSNIVIVSVIVRACCTPCLHPLKSHAGPWEHVVITGVAFYIGTRVDEYVTRSAHTKHTTFNVV